MELPDHFLISLYYSLEGIKDIINLASTCKGTLQVYRGLNLWALIHRAPGAKKKLQWFLAFYDHLPEQGTLKWKEGRRGEDRYPIWGGSEIGGLCRLKGATAYSQVIGSKVGLNHFAGSVATRWGNLFEDVEFRLTETILGITCYECKSIPGMRIDGKVIQAYSPDRVAYVHKSLYRKRLEELAREGYAFITHSWNEPEEAIILLEGKCPFSRIPDGKLPPQYAYQPLLGAATIPIVDSCLYVETVFRKCHLDAFGWDDNIDRFFHKECPYTYPLAMGFIGIYRVRKRIYREDWHHLFTPPPSSLAKQVHSLYLQYRSLREIYTLPSAEVVMNHFLAGGSSSEMADILEVIEYYERQLFAQNPIDYGKTRADFYDLLKDLIDGSETGTLKIYHPENYCYNPLLKLKTWNPEVEESPSIWLETEMKRYIDFCYREGHEVVGVLPWKMFNISFITIEKDPSFLEKIKDTLLGAVELVRNIKEGCSSPQEIEKKYRVHFPGRAKGSKED